MSGPEYRRDAEWRRSQDVFRKRHVIRLEAFVAPDVLARLRPMLRAADEQLRTRDHVNRRDHVLLARERALPRGAPLATFLQILLNKPRLFAAVGEFTEHDETIRSFDGRYRKMSSDGNHFDTWHDDWMEGRRFGFSINLSMEPAVGGGLQLRRWNSEAIQTIAPGRFGDATLFRLGPSLCHRALPPRCGYAGWFTTRSLNLRATLALV